MQVLLILYIYKKIAETLMRVDIIIIIIILQSFFYL